MAQHFESIRRVSVASLNLTVEEYRHTTTGSRHIHLATDDANNCFMVALPTVPQDSRGVAHVLEHTALCGSERYPVRDPFFMMTRRSLYSFMNAFTTSDATAYPFASKNRKDFDNLLAVYLDAIFFPRLDELDFAQEGWRVEFAESKDPASPLVFKGIVYNEMKGAMSPPTAQISHHLQAKLFPTTTYQFNSGGDPQEIPSLSYRQLRDFHATHYHPSNAILMTYGDFPAAEHQEHFHEWALKRFPPRPLDFSIPDERRYTAPIRVETTHTLDGEIDPGERTHVVLGWLLGYAADTREALRMQFLSGILLENSASPLRHALETTDLGTAPSALCGLDDSTREASFSCGLEGTREDAGDAVEALIMGVLNEIAEKGVPEHMIEAVLQQMELQQREISGGSYPYGLQLMGRILPAVLHGGDAVAPLDLDPHLADLRAEAERGGLVERLTRQWLIDNPHRVRLVSRADPGQSAREAQAENARLVAMKATLTPQDEKVIVAQAAELDARQRRKDDPEILPGLGLADVPADIKIPLGRTDSLRDMQATWFVQGTNGLVHEQVVVELPEFTTAEVDTLPLFWSFLTELGCGKRDYLAMQGWQSLVGAIRAYTSARGNISDSNRIQAYLALAGKGLARNHESLAEILRVTLMEVRFDEMQRLRELVAQSRVALEESVTSQGHSLALLAAGSGMGPCGALESLWDGPLAVRRIKELDDALDDDAAVESLAAELTAIRDRIVAAPRRLLFVSEAQHQDAIREVVGQGWSTVNGTAGGDHVAFNFPTERHQVREAWSTNTQVSFCAKAYPAVPPEHADAPALAVLARFLHNGYLHRAIREQGGAYGSGANYDSDSGSFRFFSYRDPRLEATLADFDNAVDWLRRGQHDEQALVEAILGVIRTIDQPSSPAMEAIRTYFQTLHGRTPEYRRWTRQRVLQVRLDDLVRVAETYLAPERASVGVISDPRSIEAIRHLDLTVRSL